jgi:murein L,D-transpeptidase YcbB/YkuD
MTLRSPLRAIFLLIIFWMTLGTSAGFARDDLVGDTIQTKVELIRDQVPLKVGDADIASKTLLPDIYERNQFNAIWTNSKTIATFIEIVEQIHTHGLNPSDYHLDKLRQFRTAVQYDPQNSWIVSDFDILLTESLIRLLYHLFYGKVDPVTLYPEWNFNRQLKENDPARIILDAVKRNNVNRLVDSLIPDHTYYQQLQQALARYLAIQGKNGWPVIPENSAVLMKDVRDKRITLLRQRLEMTGDLTGTHQSESDEFDEALQQAIQQFQRRHSLEPDGTVNRITLDELNQPVGDLIDQIKANLERARWVMHDLPNRFLVIDICGYTARLFNAQEVQWSERIQVGQPFRQTPTFKSAVKYMVLNPTWTIPPGILEQDILPESRGTENYFKKQGIRVYNRKGRQIDPEAIDFENYDTYSFQYRFVKEPRPDNPLGSIKFAFPNRHFIYLHDTFEKDAFEEEWRAFSSGCIRVESPLVLAVKLLNDPAKWNLERLTGSLKSGKTRTIHLSRPVPIMLLYMTVYVDKKGLVYFREDVYERDRAVIDGLEKPFAFTTRP